MAVAVAVLYDLIFLRFVYYYYFSFSCQNRLAAGVNIAIDFISYLINVFASFGWQSAHTIYCVKFIRINQRALMEQLKNIRWLEPIKDIAISVAANGNAI